MGKQTEKVSNDMSQDTPILENSEGNAEHFFSTIASESIGQENSASEPLTSKSKSSTRSKRGKKPEPEIQTTDVNSQDTPILDNLECNSKEQASSSSKTTTGTVVNRIVETNHEVGAIAIE